MNINLINNDCFKTKLKKGGFDLILTDPPYGVLNTKNVKNKMYASWDIPLNAKELLSFSHGLVRDNSRVIFFAQGAFTADLINKKPQNLTLSTRAIWLKNNWGNHLTCKKALLSQFEDIVIFNKFYRFDRQKNHPLRAYAKKIIDFIDPITATKIRAIFEHCHLDHFLKFNALQFSLCKKQAYLQLVKKFHLEKMQGFLSYEKLKKIDEIFKKENNILEPVFNLHDKSAKSNVFEYPKETKSYHKTQKPVVLLEDLILTYTNKGDHVLDLTFVEAVQLV